MRIKIKVCLFLLFLVSFQTVCAKPIKFATEASYYPFESLNPAGEVEGFETDVIKAICQQMEADCTFTHQPWESLIMSVQTGKFDAVYNGIEITPERMQRVAFTQVIYDNLPGMIIPKADSSRFTTESLRNKKIGVQIGTTFEQYISNLNMQDKKINKPKLYANIQLALLDFSGGSLDVVLADYPILAQWESDHDKGKIYKSFVLPAQERTHFGEGYAIAMNKKDKVLSEQINAGIDVIKENGTYDEIYQRYFGEDDVH